MAMLSISVLKVLKSAVPNTSPLGLLQLWKFNANGFRYQYAARSSKLPIKRTTFQNLTKWKMYLQICAKHRKRYGETSNCS